MKDLKDIKKLGFGLMRLPKNGEEIDIEQTKVMVDKFLAAGFNYFDTAFAYTGSEEAIRKALVDRYDRESYYLATKNAAWINCKTREEAIAQFTTSLERTNAGYIDLYLLHNLGSPRTEAFDKFDMWSFVKEKKDEGLIRHYGFSFHGTPEELEVLLNDHPDVEFVQLQINYDDWESPKIRARECYEICCRHGKPVIVMEPVKGGSLADPIPSVKKVFDEADPSASPSSWAIRYAASLDNVLTVLSGMSNIEQMDDNLKTMANFKPFDDEDRKVIEKVEEALKNADSIPCTNCQYCIHVCPNEIGINDFFKAYNEASVYNNIAKAKQTYERSIKQGKNPASSCIQCASCEGACPQHLPIVELLADKIVKTFE